MTPEKIDELVKVIYEQALQGDMRAAKLILSYSVGQPRPAVDPDRLDADEMDVFGKQAGSPGEFERILHSPTARMMCMLLQTMVPGFEKEALGKLAAGIKEMDEKDRMRAGGAGQAVRSQAEPAEPGNEEERCRQQTEESKAVQAPRAHGTGGQSHQWHPSSGPGNEKEVVSGEKKAPSGNGEIQEDPAPSPRPSPPVGRGREPSTNRVCQSVGDRREPEAPSTNRLFGAGPSS
jgi:hypothetical protein